MFDFTSRFQTGNKNLLTYVTSNTSDSSRISNDYFTWNHTILLLFFFKQITTIVNSINIHRNIIVYFVIIGFGIHRFKNESNIVWLDRYEVISERIREKKILRNFLQISYSIVDPTKFVFVMWTIICTTLKFSNQLISSKGNPTRHLTVDKYGYARYSDNRNLQNPGTSVKDRSTAIQAARHIDVLHTASALT